MTTIDAARMVSCVASYETALILYQPCKIRLLQRETMRWVRAQVTESINEPCTMQACKKINRRFPRSLVMIITQFFDECKEEFMENSHPVCKECADKVKRSFMGEKVLRKEAYREIGTKLSTKQVKFIETYDNERAERAETLCKILLTA